MSNLIKLKIITPEKTVYEDEVVEITVPTTSGEIGVLANHMPLVSVLKMGEIHLRKPGIPEPVVLSISRGVIEVRPSIKALDKQTEVVILAIRSELAREIDVKRAEEAYERAEKAMKEKENLSDVEFAGFQAMVDKELNRIKVARKWRK